jgi:hypothetical protein
MVALTGDFNIVSTGITAGFAAVFFSSGYVAQARCVRALFSFLICHHDSFPELLLRFAPHYDSLRGPIHSTEPNEFEMARRSSRSPMATLYLPIAFGSPNSKWPPVRGFASICAEQQTETTFQVSTD